MMIETIVESIRVSLVTQTRVVILKEVHGERHLPIWIGAYEAEAIAMELQGVTATRPLPYDLLKNLIHDLGASVERVLITELTDEVFYARIVIRDGEKTIELDSRPSDALALAVRTQVPILVDEAVMDQAGVVLGSGDEEALAHPSAGRRNEAIEPERSSSSSPADDEKLSVFRDFINSLDLDDFDKGD
jgi:bifunctional DNase/RNase